MNNIFYKLKLACNKFIFKKDIMEVKNDIYRKKGIKIGDNTRIFSELSTPEPYLIEIGNNVTISTNVKFTTHDNSVSKIMPKATDLFGKIKIGNNCFIGQNTILMPGTVLGDNIIVGAGSVVTKSFTKKNVIIAGNPAKIISTWDSYKEKYQGNAMCTRNLSYEEKKEYILSNKGMLLKK